jgi:sugar-specific transcriptional regulator TrmB
VKKIIDYLRRLEFSEQEAKIYLILLKAGSLTVAEIARKAGINRTAAYGHIYSLLEKGVFSQTKGSSSKIQANPPAQLNHLVDQKIEFANVLKEDLSPIITMLNASYMQSKPHAQSETRYYKGKMGVKSIYEESLKATKIRSYFNPIDIVKTFPENVALFHETISKNTKLKVFEIAEDSAYTREQITLAKITKRHYWKLLPKDIKLTSNDILIYNGKVAIINIGDQNNITGVVLENIDYYNNSVQLFDLLWRFLPRTENEVKY